VSMGLDTAGTQPAVLLFALAVSIGTVVVFGLAPALAASRVDLSDGLKSGSRSVAGGQSRVQDLLVVGQVALSVVLLVGAGLLVRSFVQLRGVDPGFSAQGLLTAGVSLPRTTYPEPAQRSQFFDAFLERTRSLPGVNGAAMISALPVRAPGNNIGVWDPSHPPADASHLRLAYQRVVKPGYFQVMKIPIRRGRDIASTDAAESRPVVVITDALANTLFPGENPLGRVLAVDNGNASGARFDIVGIVGDVRMQSLDDASDQAMYFSFEQRPQYTMELAVRADAPAQLARPLRAALANMDPNIPLQTVRTMDAVLADSISSARVMTSVLTGFAGVALLLAALGLYGLMAYYVTRRRREIGIRMALGAKAGDVFSLVLSRGFRRVGFGLVLGVISSLAVTRLPQTLLFHVTATDPVTFIGVSAFFAAVSLVACLVPAWRAMRVDPVEAFRTE
jgi:putative ABC transport system permease protein